MTHGWSTIILVCIKELSLFDLVDASDAFLWGQDTLNHFFGNFYSHLLLLPLLDDRMFGVSSYERSCIRFNQTLPLSVTLQRPVTMIRIIVLKSADLAINHCLDQSFGRHWRSVIKSVFWKQTLWLNPDSSLNSGTLGNSVMFFPSLSFLLFCFLSINKDINSLYYLEWLWGLKKIIQVKSKNTEPGTSGLIWCELNNIIFWTKKKNLKRKIHEADQISGIIVLNCVHSKLIKSTLQQREQAQISRYTNREIAVIIFRKDRNTTSK